VALAVIRLTPASLNTLINDVRWSMTETTTCGSIARFLSASTIAF